MEPRHTTVAIPIELMDRVKEYREENKMGYSTNSEVVRQAIREFILKEKNQIKNNDNGHGEGQKTPEQNNPISPKKQQKQKQKGEMEKNV
jgi:Arc/MetJ-type ribon-helix-helix transcriptional regulator